MVISNILLLYWSYSTRAFCQMPSHTGFALQSGSTCSIELVIRNLDHCTFNGAMNFIHWIDKTLKLLDQTTKYIIRFIMGKLNDPCSCDNNTCISNKCQFQIWLNSGTKCRPKLLKWIFRPILIFCALPVTWCKINLNA